MIQAAQRCLTVVSFVYQVPAVVSALRAPTGSGVRVRLVLDGGAAAELPFRELADEVEIYTWPASQAAESHPAHASLPAKLALADDSPVFVTSDNLTEAALDRYGELGLLVRGCDVPRVLAAHFEEMIRAGTVVEVEASRRATPSHTLR
ncbi:MAG: phospholipase D-like domain-containing protein [Acidimicrobiales bacterium]